MSKKIAINGFGRIGRNFFRTLYGRDDLDIDIQYVNDLFHPKFLAYALKYDTVFGRFPGEVDYKEGALIIDGEELPVTAERDPANLPHSDYGVEVALESTGFFTNRDGASKHLEAGADKVLISAPASDPDITVVLGCNDEKLTDDHKIISNASCTTNCLGPVVKVLRDNFGIEQGIITTVHSYTSTQSTVDRAKDAKPIKMTRGRAAAANTIPTSTGAAAAIGLVFPELNGKLDGMALRTQTPDGSVVDGKYYLSEAPSIEEINAAMKEAAEGELKGILEYTEDPIVSSDIIGNPASSIVCGIFTNAIGQLSSVLSWYDNEWGYSNRLADLINDHL
ncbi:MAG: type I glyceraldehyde-3-phosphate dehydrogenase [Promethearchaeota archaeon]|nr:MAG: type I glyceraldehyde-3-phosphate dehydrogenase [Candidatus Lokiarchaeota archaeon]